MKREHQLMLIGAGSVLDIWASQPSTYTPIRVPRVEAKTPEQAFADTYRCIASAFCVTVKSAESVH